MICFDAKLLSQQHPSVQPGFQLKYCVKLSMRCMDFNCVVFELN